MAVGVQIGHRVDRQHDAVAEVATRSWHIRMQQVSRATALSPSATTRLVTRLENRGYLRRILCDDDRRGIYTELTQAGADVLAEVQPLHDAALTDALRAARDIPELSELVDAVPGLSENSRA